MTASARGANAAVGWSVMVPTYRPDPDHLARALASACAQLPDRAQIEIVDDDSEEFDPQAFLRERGLRGVASRRNRRRLGMAANWNRCIRLAHGRVVHILHQDDFVLPGFYSALGAGLETGAGGAAGAAFCAPAFLEPDGRRRLPCRIAQPSAGPLEGWQEHVFADLQIQTAAIVVRREVYDRLGGFDESLSYAADWDMWKRIAARYPLWYEPRVLACYRRHRRSQSARLRASGATIAELALSIERSRSLLPAPLGEWISGRARRRYTLFAFEEALALLRSGAGLGPVGANLREACRLGSPTDVAAALSVLSRRALVRVRRGCCPRPSPPSH